MRENVLSIAAAITFTCAGAHAMELSSVGIANGASLPLDQVKASCGGKNISPALSWSGEPAGTKSFAVTLFDPDATGGWWHWTVYDIPANAHALASGAIALPAGANTGSNDFGNVAYDGACPPPGSGPHHYQFAVWAMGTTVLPREGATDDKIIGAYIKTHALASATITAVYER